MPGLILDEIGYLPMNREESSLFFRQLNRRYEKAVIILTSNKGFADWGEMSGDHVLATAILSWQRISGTGHGVRKDVMTGRDTWLWRPTVTLPMIKNAAKTIGKRIYGILNAMRHRVSNGNAEALNSKIRLLRIKARGYRNGSA